ncbi:MAG: DUF1616 domain-containing protein [Dehalococcoidia bacterium]
MRLDNRIILTAIAILMVALIPIAIFTSGPLRIILSFLCLFFFPGYSLLSALLPKQDDLGIVERIALSLGASIATVPIIGFVLNFTPWGIRLIPVLVTVAAFTLIAAAIGFIRQQMTPINMRLHVSIAPHWTARQGMTYTRKVIWVAVLLAAFGAVSTLIYFEVSLPGKSVPTDFYILNAEGKAENYPSQVKAGDNITLTAVVINHESQPVSYFIKAVANGNTIGEASTLSLAEGAKWEGKVSLTLKVTGQRQKIDLYLYKDSEQEPYFKEPLGLYIDVTE